MDYLEIKLPKCTLLITQKEMLRLLSFDTDLYKEGLKRGKIIQRSSKQRKREEEKLIDFLNSNKIK